MYIQIKIIKKMFNLFGKKNQKEEFKYREKIMSNRMNDLALKIIK